MTPNDALLLISAFTSGVVDYELTENERRVALMIGVETFGKLTERSKVDLPVLTKKLEIRDDRLLRYLRELHRLQVVFFNEIEGTAEANPKPNSWDRSRALRGRPPAGNVPQDLLSLESSRPIDAALAEMGREFVIAQSVTCAGSTAAVAPATRQETVFDMGQACQALRAAIDCAPGASTASAAAAASLAAVAAEDEFGSRRRGGEIGRRGGETVDPLEINALHSAAVAAENVPSASAEALASSALFKKAELKLRPRRRPNATNVATVDQAWDALSRHLVSVSPKQHREWRALTERDPGYIAGLVRRVEPLCIERRIANPIGYMARIARDEMKLT